MLFALLSLSSFGRFRTDEFSGTDDGLLVQNHTALAQSNTLQRALPDADVLCREYAVYGRDGAEVIVPPALHQMHMDNLCHKPFL